VIEKQKKKTTKKNRRLHQLPGSGGD